MSTLAYDATFPSIIYGETATEIEAAARSVAKANWEFAVEKLAKPIMMNGAELKTFDDFWKTAGINFLFTETKKALRNAEKWLEEKDRDIKDLQKICIDLADKLEAKIKAEFPEKHKQFKKEMRHVNYMRMKAGVME